jgi:thymidylate synthase
MAVKPVFLEARDLGDAWFQALDEAMLRGRRYLITKGSYEGQNRSGKPITILINHPGTRPLFPIMPDGLNVPPPTTEDDINEYTEYLMTGRRRPNEHYTYGEDLSWLIEWVIKHYRKYGYGTNHCYMAVGRPETVFFYDRGVNYHEEIIAMCGMENEEEGGKVIVQREISNLWNKDQQIETSSQCLRGIDTWIDEGELMFWCYFRSWDLWGGFPVNLGGIQLVKEYMADAIGVKDGYMVVSSKDLHVYEHAWAVALMRLRKSQEGG